ncbi:putative divalent cation tolerance protein [Rhizoclosmatium globosum]|uniref:Putative divalent cation tolerance protein n=1 Tax=Rhizoclosmatium globosum TaxID=329046 RepID=A0A1Y2C199_9FUNG|nr:putative divalent cation tolerance protein [Rhizoclosmatium globosum]|eukprot:ORY40085.1 putative divalent cation tolerance protein [Rhizoclosmatium globosum]
MISVVYITTPSLQVAKELASSLLEARLIACANLVPQVVSMYRWEGKVNIDEEVLLMCKTQTSLFPSLQAHVLSKHPYKVPEIISVNVQDSLPAYRDWVVAETTK